ncbi:hypothetical protein RFI_17433 [Reticulomyxa filosa]|uniref:EF-hand domain-containing protein n=1 Tax=Reticulomyxa filosa TaxID=46433 RepID=X6N227_RETFI|nr:hypothetical protein RFI_17433 [Reticulomyxa filosa]|eukprot:ETO19799.1 hypothetical protein RFI_17433 [Reticulomyxa filosa]
MIDFPQLTASRIRYYDKNIDQDSVYFYYNLDWVVCSLVSIPARSSHFADQMVMLISTVLFVVFFLMVLEQVRSKAKKKEKQHYQKVEPAYEDIKHDVKKVVLNACNSSWAQDMEEKRQRAGASMVVTMNQAKLFLCDRAIQHMESQDYEQGKMFMFETCQMETNKDWFHLKFIRCFSHPWYDACLTIIIAIHLLLACWEPATPSLLQKNGLQSWIAAISGLCIAIQVIDFVIQFTIRYMRFKSHYTKSVDDNVCFDILQSLQKLSLSCHGTYRPQFWYKYHQKHWQRAVIGPGEVRFILHGLIVCLVLVSFICAVTVRVAPFSYYVPILPLLLVLRNTQLFHALFDVARGIAYARDVLFLGFFMVFVTAALGMDLFANTLNARQSFDNFDQVSRAFVTSFVFIVGSDNFNNLVYPAKDISPLSLLFFVIILLSALYALLPMTINRFEASFREARLSSQQKRIDKLVNAFVSAFVCLDLDQSGDISRTEFENLVRRSTHANEQDLWGQLNFGNIQDETDNSIDLDEFISVMSEQDMFTSFKKRILQYNSSRWNAYLETHWFRSAYYRKLIFWFGVLPSLFSAALYRLAPLHSNVLDVVAIYCFIINLLEIFGRCYVFGYMRFIDMVNQPDPLLIQVSSQIWRETIGQSDDGLEYIHVTSDDYQWAATHVKPRKPLEKRSGSNFLFAIRWEWGGGGEMLKSPWDKQRLTWINRIELWWAAVSLIVVIVILSIDPSQKSLLRFWLHMPVLTRVFTLLLVNQRLVLSLYTVIPNFVSLLGLAIAFVYAWARVGTTLFADKERVVLSQSYSQRPNGSFFRTFPDTILTLLSVMVGQGWSSIIPFYVCGKYICWSHFSRYKQSKTNQNTKPIKKKDTCVLMYIGIEELEDRENDLDLISQCFDGTQTEFLEMASESLEQLEAKRRRDEKKIVKIKNLVKLRNKRKQQRKKDRKQSDAWEVRKLFSVNYWSGEYCVFRKYQINLFMFKFLEKLFELLVHYVSMTTCDISTNTQQYEVNAITSVDENGKEYII